MIALRVATVDLTVGTKVKADTTRLEAVTATLTAEGMTRLSQITALGPYMSPASVRP